MGKNLFSIGGLYFTCNKADTINGTWGKSSEKGIGCTWGISSDLPDRIQGMAISSGYIRAAVVSGNFEIMLCDIESINTFDVKGKGKKSAVHLTLKNGAVHIMDVKSPAKAENAVAALLHYKSAITTS